MNQPWPQTFPALHSSEYKQISLAKNYRQGKEEKAQ
jgi:hypothetical protein